MSVLISPAELTRLLAKGIAPKLLDVRWSPIAPHGQADYVSGHLPGAAYVDLEHELSLRGARSEGRRPLPPIEDLQSAVRRWGISEGDTVVVYDDAAGLAASRAWWLLRHAGLTDVRILDGALSGWRKSGGHLQAGTPLIERGNAVLSYGHLPTVTIDQAAELPTYGVLLDARAPERYRGEAERLDRLAGHIPGAVNAPASENLTPEGNFRSAHALRARFTELGLSEHDVIAVYGGSGITASQDIAALAIAGFSAALYPGSWSQWVNTPGRPIETEENSVDTVRSRLWAQTVGAA